MNFFSSFFVFLALHDSKKLVNNVVECFALRSTIQARDEMRKTTSTLFCYPRNENEASREIFHINFSTLLLFSSKRIFMTRLRLALRAERSFLHIKIFTEFMDRSASNWELLKGIHSRLRVTEEFSGI